MGAGEIRIERLAPPAPPVVALLGSATSDDRPFVLASGPGDPELSRWSYAALEPIGQAPDLERARDQIADWPHALTGPPFVGGAVGYLGYDLGFSYVKKPRPIRADPLGLPPAHFGLYDAIYARDERSGEGFLLFHDTAACEQRARRIERALREAKPLALGAAEALAPRITRPRYDEKVQALLEHIRAGDIYQANLSYAVEGRYRGSAAAAFARLLAAPPPFAALLDLGAGQAVLSASMECFFDLDGPSRRIRSYPIKGTRKRDPDPEQDAALARALLASEKDRAEHLMIVDLIRNDLSRVAQTGSVQVEDLAYVESFPTLHHLTSRIAARLAEGVDTRVLLQALFPGGSITGAPKLRAMELIDGLEGEARGVYTGAILYATPSGSIRSSIAIRTASFADGQVRFGVGGGIVADSTPELEWQETVLKAQALARALAP